MFFFCFALCCFFRGSMRWHWAKCEWFIRKLSWFQNTHWTVDSIKSFMKKVARLTVSIRARSMFSNLKCIILLLNRFHFGDWSHKSIVSVSVWPFFTCSRRYTVCVMLLMRICHRCTIFESNMPNCMDKSCFHAMNGDYMLRHLFNNIAFNMCMWKNDSFCFSLW